MAKGYSLEFKRVVVDEYKSNRYTAGQIASKHGVSEAVVYKWVKEDSNGVLAEPKETRVRTDGKLSREQVEAIILEYTTENIGIHRLSSKYGVVPTSIIYILKKAGVYQGAESGKQRQPKLSQDGIQGILNDYMGTDKPIQVIASESGITRGYVHQILHKYGVEKKDRSRKVNTDKPKYTLAPEVIADYNTGLFSHGDLAKVFKVSTRTISRILDEAGIKADNSIKTVSADEVAKVIDKVKADSDEGMDVYTCAKKHSIPMHTVEKILEGRYNRLKVTRGGETVVNYYTPVKKEVRVDDVIASKVKDSENKDSEKKSRIAELHSQGLVVREIALESGLTPYHVTKILEELGLELNSPAEKHKELVSSLAIAGKSAKDIALEVGISVPTVRKLLDESGISLKDIARERKEDTPVEDKKGQRNDLVMKCVAEGLTVNEITEKVGISIPTVRKVLADNGVELNRGKPLLQN